jgi:hypothetical protein
MRITDQRIVATASVACQRPARPGTQQLPARRRSMPSKLGLWHLMSGSG